MAPLGMAQTAGESARAAGESAGSSVGNTLGQAGNAVKGATHKAGNAVEGAAGATKGFVKGAASSAKNAIAPTLKTEESPQFGQYLTTGNGMSLYMFEADTGGTSSCYEKCAVHWPPLITPADTTPIAGSGIDSSKISTSKRKDGSMQVTYNHLPLYTFADDKNAGDTKGENLGRAGARWYLVSPAGNPIKPSLAR